MPRTLRLLYFAAVREAAGAGEELLALPEEVRTVRDLAEWLDRERPNLTGRLGAVRFAVNETFADAETALSSGDVVALIPPVSGG
jgi:molybdopterin synthase sulfur carrier subunit